MRTKTCEVRQIVWDSPAPAVANASGIHAAISTAVVTTSGITNPDVCRTVRIVGAGSGHAATGNVVVNGTDILGNVISDTIALNGTTEVEGVHAFATVTSIDTTGVTGIDTNDTVEVGFGASLGLGEYCDAFSFSGIEAGLVTSYAYSTTVISLNVLKLSATLDGSTAQGIFYIPAIFEEYNRTNE